MSSSGPATPAAQAGRWVELLSPEIAPATVMISLGVAIFAFNAFIVSTTMPTAVAELRAEAYLSWTFTAYVTASIVSGSCASLLKAALGARAALQIASLVFLFGNALVVWGDTIAMIIAGRLFQGLGEGLVSAICYSLVPTLFPGRLVQKVFGVEAIVWAVAAFGGPALAGWLTEVVGWRNAYNVNLPVVLIFMLLVLGATPRSGGSSQSATIPGLRLALVAAMMTAVSVAGVSHDVVLQVVLIALAALAAIAVKRLDDRSREPLLPNGAFSLRSLAGAGLAAIVLMPVAQSVTTLFTVYAAQHVWGQSATFAGIMGSVLAVSWSLTAIVVASRRTKGGSVGLIARGTIGLTLSLLMATLCIWQASMAGYVTATALVGIAMGMSWANLCQTVMDHSSPGERDKASSFLPVLQSAGYALGMAVMGLVANLSGFAEATTPDAIRAALTPTLAFATFMSLAPALTIYAMVRLSRAPK